MGKKISYLVIALAIAWSAGSAMGADIGKGNILIEEWHNTGGAVTDNVDTLHSYINAGNLPTRSYWVKAMDRPDGGEDYWGDRMRGYIYPPQTGDYTFWTCSDDDSEVWLSTDDSPANVKMICNVEGWTDYQNWSYSTGSPGTTYKSAAIPLQAGKRYYVEVYHSDGTGGGVVSVGWGGPGIGAGPVLVDGKYLAPFIRDPEPMLGAQSPSPADGAIGVTMPLIQWTAGVTALWHDFYFGTDPNPPFIDRRTFTVYFAAGGLEPGQTYYWKVDEVEADGVTMHYGPVWSFTVQSLDAFAPSPADGATGVLPGLVLTWMAGKDATGQHVFFGSDMTAVAEGAASVDQGTIEETEFNTGALRASTTYYWRVDTITKNGVVEGDVWSFTTLDAGPANKIVYEYWLNIGGTAISNLTSNPRYPNNPDHVEYVDSIDSAVDWADNYGQRYWGWLKPPETGDYTFWVAGDDYQEFWLSTDANPANTTMIANVAGYTGARDFDNAGGTASAAQKSAAIPLKAGEKYFFMVIGKEGGGGDSTSAAWQGPGIPARVIITSEYVDAFALKPLIAFGPLPGNGVVDTVHAPTLSWQAGEFAQQHEVYLGDDPNAMAAADASSPLFKGRQAGTTFDAGELEWGKTYYWRVDEVGATESWKGMVWSFTTADFLPIDDMESYDDDMEAETTIWQTWIDGLTNGTGSQVGYDDSPFAEQTITHNASRQSMPFYFDNDGTFRKGNAQYERTGVPFYSEIEREFSPVQNWTVNEVNALTLYVRGYPVVGTFDVTETSGKISLTGAGADIWGTSDQFSYAYKTLTGDGTMIAQVLSTGTGTSTWAKGGVMIRGTLNGNSAHAMMVLTGGDGNGAAFQNRATDGLDQAANDAASNTTSGTVIAPPYWVKIERMGDSFTGYVSLDGTVWSPLGTAIVPMTDPVYIGLCVTSHQAGENRTFEFSSLSTTGSVTGTWQGAVINSPVHNSVQPLYVTVVDSANKTATVTNDTAVNSATWTEVKIPLTDFAGVNFTKVKKLIIGVGDSANPTADGEGRIFIDDIRGTRR